MNPNASPFFPSHYSLDSRTKSNSPSTLNPHAPEYTPKLVQGFKNPSQETCDDLKHDSARAGLSERQLSYIYDSEEKFDEPNLKAFKYWQNHVPPPLLRQKGIFERGKVMELSDVELRENLEKAWAMLDLHTDGTKRMQERIIYLQGLIKTLEEELEIEKKSSRADEFRKDANCLREGAIPQRKVEKQTTGGKMLKA